MQRFEVQILGCNAAVPGYGRHPSAQVLYCHNKCYLIDCGEGTQMRMLHFGVQRNKLNQIFISHLHGDHIFGLVGLLTSMSLQGRKEKMELFGPVGLKALLKVHEEICQVHLSFDLIIVELAPQTEGLIFRDSLLEVRCFPLLHGITTFGYRFTEREKLKNILPEMIAKYYLSYADIKAIKKGNDYTKRNGDIVPNAELTEPAAKLRSYAYCSDTAFCPAIVPFIKNVTLLYHESTFLTGREVDANKYGHSTVAQAVEIAVLAEAEALLLGHFSTRYPDSDAFEVEAKAIFLNARAAHEGCSYLIGSLFGKVSASAKASL